jgi:hypothetical protein
MVRPTRRTFVPVRSVICAALTAAALAACFTAADARAAPPAGISWRGAITLPATAVDAAGNSVPVTGLSGIAWLGGDRYAAAMDNSRHVLLFRLTLSQTGKPLAVDGIRAMRLSQRHDFEDVAACPAAVAEALERERHGAGSRAVGGDDQAVLLCEEDTPAVRAFSLADGRMVGAVALPDNLLSRRPNRGLESLAVEPDGRFVWTANEEPLPADGLPTAAAAPGIVRLTRLPLPRGGEPAAATLQLAYPVDPPHEFVRVFAGQPLSGLVALAAVGGGRLLALERSGAPGLPPFASRIYAVDSGGARDVSQVEGDLAGRVEARLEKRLLWGDALGVNLEGLCLGPWLADGNRAVVAVADNGGLGTPNQLVGLAWETRAVPVRPGLVAAVAALVAIALVVGRLTSP